MKKILLILLLLISTKLYSQNEIYGFYDGNEFKMSQKGTKQYLFLRTDENGYVVWAKTLDELNSYDEIVLNEQTNEFIVAGKTKLDGNKIISNPYDYEYWFVRKQDSSNVFTVYPNPTTSNTFLFTDLDLVDVTPQIKLFDSKFGLIYSEILNRNNQMIDLSSLESGLYFLFIETPKQNKLLKITKL